MAKLLYSWVLIDKIQGTPKSPELKSYIDRFLQIWNKPKGIANLIYRKHLHAILDNLHDEQKLLREFKRLFKEV